MRIPASAYLSAAFVCVACRSADPGNALRPVYPELLRQARLNGFVQFRVGLDTLGRPDVKQLKIVASSNAGFDLAVKRAVSDWRPHVPPGVRTIDHAILFWVLADSADSARACRPSRGLTVVCARPPPVLEHNVY